MHWLTRLFRKEKSERQLDAELRFHLEKQIADYQASGLSSEEARRRAHLQFGALESIKQQSRESRRANWLDTFRQDALFGLRMLRKNPGFAAIAILTLALGIGATSAVFSVVNTVLLRALPYRDSSRLVWVANENPREHMTMVIEPDFFAYQRQLPGIFESVAAYEPGSTFTLTGAGDAIRVDSAGVSYNFFDTLGVKLQLGRTFLPEEDRRNAAHVVLLTDLFWRQRFAADPAILNRSIVLDGTSYRVVGVLPPKFEFLDNSRADVITPSALEVVEITRDKPIRLVQVVARLRPGITPAAAVANVDAVNQRQWASYPPMFADMLKGSRAIVMPLHEHLVGKVQPALLVLLGAVAFVLLIACANIANLQLARAVSREREIAIRGALGAGRWRLLRQLLTENGIIALAGGGLGLLVAAWLVQILRTHGPTGAARIPHLAASQLNLPVFVFALVTSLAAGMLFGLAPALASFRVSIVETIKEGGMASGAGLKIRRSHNIFAIAELALALVLFIGAGLLLRSFTQLASISPGFDSHGVLTARISLPVNFYQTQETQLAFFRELETRLSALPGVEFVGLANTLPLQGFDLGTVFQRNDRPQLPLGQAPTVPVGVVTPGYFSALRIPLLRGRLLNRYDSRDAANSLVINEAYAQRHFPGENPVGKQLRTPADERGNYERRPADQGDAGLWTIVGVVGNAKQRGLAAEIEPQVFVPVEKWCPPELAFMLRTKGDPESLLPSVRAIVANLDKNVPIFSVETANEILQGEIASQRFNAVLLTAFAVFAVLLAAIGIYGVLAYAVHQRIREVGIRIALGATPPNVLWLILSHGLTLAGLGLAAGIAGSFALTRLMGSLLYGVRPTDPLTFIGAALTLAFISLAACYFPARRAMRVDPIVALRYE
jgi:putative ABC transport system permease protein